MIQLHDQENVVVAKTRELCQTILDQEEFCNIRTRIDLFLSDDRAQAMYESVNSKGQELQQKQQSGQTLTDEEIAGFEQDREAFLNNPVARGFLDAQQEMHQMKEVVVKYVSKTFELGRMPAPDDFSSCGHGCNCH
jgi:cell fate (sporulation/competence/biofilm development) regulator YlbF (YheA/YmcA/DUF963 family)